MLDISFTGGYITVEAGAMGKTVINEFSDDGSPIEIDDIEVTGHGISLNGTVIRWRKPAAYTVKLTVIPGSENDASLTKLLKASKVEPTGNGVYCIAASNLNTTLEVNAPQINDSGTSKGMRSWKFSEGCIVSGAPAISSDAEGKMQAKSFNFVFERMTYNGGDGKVIEAGSTNL